MTQRLYDAANGTSGLGTMGLEILDYVAPMPIGDLVRNLNAMTTVSGNSVERRVPEVRLEVAAVEVIELPWPCGTGQVIGRACRAH